MVAGCVGELDDLCSLESLEVYAGNTRRVVGIDEEPAPVVHGVGLRELRVVGVVPWHEAKRGVEHGLGVLVVAVAVLTIL